MGASLSVAELRGEGVVGVSELLSELLSLTPGEQKYKGNAYNPPGMERGVEKCCSQGPIFRVDSGRKKDVVTWPGGMASSQIEG